MNPDALFVSYAQNLEDVILWRALQHVESGFYIDVGAASPIVDSVTLAFYERGWRGINVEPHPEEYVALAGARPRDTNLRLALGDTETEMTLNLARNHALSTLDADEASRLADEGMPLREERVAVTTLRAMWAEHVPTGQAVHFLKVDVEGFEHRVLLGNDWVANRPWVVLVEATKPQTQEPSHEAWEPMLLMSGYKAAYWDGLNRYYIAQEHAELLSSFDHPPDFFDRYARSSEVDAARRAAQAESTAADLRASLDSLQASRSWMLTRPLRAAGAMLRQVRGRFRRSRDTNKPA